MRRIFVLLCLLFGLLLNFQAQANPANCDGDMTQDQTDLLNHVEGLHPILFGGPIVILRTCERIKKFLGSLTGMGISKLTQSVSRDQVRTALDEADTVFEPSSPTVKSPPLTLERAKNKRDELLLKDRELATNLVVLCKSIMNEQACVRRLLAIENLRDDVARWNKDPELMMFIPPIALDSPDLIPQTGWEKRVGDGGWYNRAGDKAEREICPELTQIISGLIVNAPERARERLPEFRSNCAERNPSYAEWLRRWDNQLAGTSTKAGVTGGAYVRGEDCDRLGRQIEADLRANPQVEPPSLSFFEVECASDAGGKFAGKAAVWKRDIAIRKATDVLNQWDGGIRQAEIQKAKEEERLAAEQRRADEKRQAAQKMREEEAVAGRQQSGESSSPRVSTGWGQSGPKAVCSAARDNYVQAFEAYGEPVGVADSPYFRGKAALAFINLGSMSGTDEAGRQIASARDRIDAANRELAKGGRYNAPIFHKLEIARATYDICLIETFRQLSGRVDLNALTGGVGSSEGVGSSVDRATAVSRQSGAADAAACDAALKRAESEVSNANPPQQGALAALQFAMWAAKKGISVLDANCPNGGKYAAMRQEWQQAYDQAAAGCRQLKSGGGECKPEWN